MKKLTCSFLMITITMLLFAASGQAYRGGWGPGWGWGPVVGLGLGVGLMELSHPYYYPSYYYPPPAVIDQVPTTIYMQQAPQTAPSPPAEPTYWYYCQDSQSYYPYVKQCPKGWMKVVPTPPAPR